MHREFPDEIDPRAIKSMVRVGKFTAWTLFLFVILAGVLGPYAEWLWFAQDVQKPQVFSATYTYRGQLFLLTFVLVWAVLYFSLRQAVTSSMVYLEKPDNIGRILVSNAINWVRKQGPEVIRLGTPLIAFISAAGFSSVWPLWMQARNATPFGKVDPSFGWDLSFFVFKLPWYRAILEFSTGMLALTAFLTVVLYAGMQALAMFAKIELGRPHIRTHLSLLVGLLIVVIGFRMLLRSYEVGFYPGVQFTGGGYAASQQAQVQMILGFIAIAYGLTTMAVARSLKAYRVLGIGGIAFVILAFLGLGVYPGVLQALVVNPDKLNREGPYAKRAIEATRFGFGLDQIEVRDQTMRERPNAQEIEASRSTLENMRLWDPEIYRQSIEGIQGLRPYYTFRDVDIDRYEVNGRRQMVMLSPRDMRLEGLNENARSWVNQRLQYTHGYGIVMSPVNQSTEMGQPVFSVRDMPVQGEGVELKEPRIYYTDDRDGFGRPSSPYTIVNTNIEEFDYPSEQSNQEHRWTGNRGIQMSSILVRALFAMRLTDGNLLVSGNIRPDSRLLMRRSVLERAQAVYPFLKFDNDPYITVTEGRIRWILDAYTSTDMIPYSARFGEGSTGLNYLRNSVKIVIDAYSGEMEAYQFADEPLIKTWNKVYPGLIKPQSEFPKPLLKHIRYPEDQLRLQAAALEEYHVTDPTSFLNNGDAWEVATERGLTGARETMRPYYVLMTLPGQKDEQFLQILPFTPRSKPNMSGWLAAKCDPEDYGRLLLYRYTRGTLVNGPAQMEAIFNQDKIVADVNRQFNNEQSEILLGNLLVVPIGQSVMYVEPLFLRSRTSGIQAPPELKKVILAFKDKVVIGDTYEEALQLLLGDRPAAPPKTNDSGEPTPPPTQQEAQNADARRALELFQTADQALRSGDFARYGEIQKQLKAQLEKLARTP